MAQLYTFISASDVSVFIPPNSSITEHQVTAQANQSGVVFVARFPQELYQYPDQVAETLNALAGGFNTWMAVPGVTGVSTFQDINDSNELVDMTNVTISSTSGKSTTVIEWYYPTVDLANETLNRFEQIVQKYRAELDAVEAA